MTKTIMLHFSYISTLILFLRGIINIISAWKTRAYLSIADIKCRTVRKPSEHSALSMMALDCTSVSDSGRIMKKLTRTGLRCTST
jgi:hypothetical protein